MKEFTVQQIIAMFPNAITRTYSAGQVIIYFGDAPDHVVLITSGAVKFYDTDSDGNEKVLAY